MRLAVLFFLLLSFSLVSAQREYNNWYFGSGAGANFKGFPPVPIKNGKQHAPEACTAVSDTNGKLLFYSNGATVWNGMQQVTCRTGMDSSATMAIFVRRPGPDSTYLLIGCGKGTSSGNILYTILDASKNAMPGKLVQQNLVLTDSSTEKIAATFHANGQDIWVLTHHLGSNRFETYKLGCHGFNIAPGDTLMQKIGSVHGAGQGSGYMKFSHDGKKLAVAVSSGPGAPGFLEIFDFDPNTGKLSNPIRVETDAYGVEFSWEMQFLYVSAGKTIYQLSLKNKSGKTMLKNAHVVTTGNASFKALGMAEDGRIYVALPGSNMVPVIDFPEKPGAACAFINTGLDLGLARSGAGLPVMLLGRPVQKLTGSLHFFGECPKKDIVCSVSTNGPVSEYHWEITDSTGNIQHIDSLSGPVLQYTKPGDYPVTVTVADGCQILKLQGIIAIKKPEEGCQ